MAEDCLANAVGEFGREFEKKLGEVKFYGPSLNIYIQDGIGRYWQCLTLQLDFNLPLRMAPIQIKVLSLSPNVNSYASEVFEKLWDLNLRSELDLKEDHINEKILRAKKEKVPLIILIGKKEAESGVFSLRDALGNKFSMEFKEIINLF